MNMIRSLLAAAFLASVVGGASSNGWAQEDSLIIDCDPVYPANTTIHVPVYARVNAHNDTGVTAITLMVYNDHPGLSTISVEWDGPSLFEEPTAINEYVGTPIVWAMSNTVGDTARGGVTMFTLGTTPSIPSGRHIFFWLKVDVGDEGDYLIEPRSGMGYPQLTNAFAYFQRESYPALVGDTVHVGMHLWITAPRTSIIAEGQELCFDVTAQDMSPEHQMTLTLIDGPAGATLDPDPNLGNNSITSQFCWTPDNCSVGEHSATFLATCPVDTVQWTTTIHVENVNRCPVFMSIDPECPLGVLPDTPLEIDVAFSDPDMMECGDEDTVIALGFSGPGHVFYDHGDGTGTYRWWPAEVDTGEHVVTFWAEDNSGDRGEHQCTILVGPPFIRGDYDCDGSVTTLDALNLLEWLLGGKGSPSCMDAADANDDGMVDNFDVLYILYFTESNLDPPPYPYPQCGADQTPDYLGCGEHHYCDSLSVSVHPPEGGSTLPTHFSLSQNYPNPFNPSTEIRYELPHTCSVELAVYNLLGRKVITLVDEEQDAGRWLARWDSRSQLGDEVAAGIYFCRLRAGGHVETRRMILLR